MQTVLYAHAFNVHLTTKRRFHEISVQNSVSFDDDYGMNKNVKVNISEILPNSDVAFLFPSVCKDQTKTFNTNTITTTVRKYQLER